MMNFVAAGLTDVGLQREHNEDSYSILPDRSLFIVADGMGGHRAGDIASQIATQTIASFFDLIETLPPDDETRSFAFDPDKDLLENRLSTSVQLANQQIFEMSVRHREVQGMGTTIVSALFAREEKRMYIAHVGDSRCYRIREGQIEQLTRDHSLVNDYLLVMPDLTEAQRRELPTNVITRALGMQEAVAVDVQAVEVAPKDRYLLCSDGLNGMLEDNEILELARDARGLEDAVSALVRGANAMGGEDNTTVVLIEIVDE
ncbi:MAG: Stp1/IreP family PP2C-type Ser/Thr phosphatase [Polyangiales bacterium]